MILWMGGGNNAIENVWKVNSLYWISKRLSGL